MKHRVIATLAVAIALVGASYATVHTKSSQPRSEPVRAASALDGLSAVDAYRLLDRARASRSRSTPTMIASPSPSGVRSSTQRSKSRVRPAVQKPAALHFGGIAPVWIALVNCEASGHWDYGKPGRYIDRGYDFEGGPNFLNSTWLAHGGGRFAHHAYDATPYQQIIIAKATLRAEGVHAWPVCGPRVGLTMADAY